MGGGTPTINIYMTVQGSVHAAEDLVSTIRSGLERAGLRNGLNFRF